MQPAKLLRILLSENDPYQEILLRCRQLGMAGATVLRGTEGYGETAALHHSALRQPDRPLVIVVVDTGDNIARLLPEVEPLLHTGVFALSSVRLKRLVPRVGLEPTRTVKSNGF
jgi:uncharacterized protein